MNNDADTLQCPTHGESSITHVCEHLAKHSKQHWHGDYPSEDNPWPDAWCDKCNVEFLKQGEWNEKNQGSGNIQLLCSSCYERGKGESVSSMDDATSQRWDSWVAQCCEKLTLKNDVLWKRFHIDDHPRWDWNQDNAEIVFSNNGKAVVVARIAFVGTVSTKSKTWRWSWANFSMVERVRAPMIAVREVGEQNSFPPLTVPQWPADESDGWHMTAIAAQLLGGEGAYRTPGDNDFTYMILQDVRWV